MLSLVCLLAMVACGGGGDDLAEPSSTPPTAVWTQATAADAAVANDTSTHTTAAPATLAPATTAPAPPSNASSPTAQSIKAGPLSRASSGLNGAGDAITPSVLVTAAAKFTQLAQATADPQATLGALATTPGCSTAFIPAASLAKGSAAALPPSGGVFYSAAELSAWRQRVAGRRFITAGDVQAGSPGDWTTIARNTQRFAEGAEPAWSASLAAPSGSLRTTHGTLLRDAAFAHLITPDAALLAKLRTRLLAEVADPGNDFARLCLRELSGQVPDAWYAEAAWLLRFTVAYDFVRQALPADDRRLIDNHLRRNASALAAQLDHGLSYVFPQRLSGDYSQRARDAAAVGEAAWAGTRADTNGDCRIDAQDDPRSFAAHNYVRGDGSLGPRTSVLSQWFNNRRAISAAAVGAAGVMLGEAGLTQRAKRYTMEWLSYGVWADGSEGEYLRNGDYCIHKQGVIYAASNIQSGLLMGRVLARQGDTSLLNFRTRAGLFGSESQAGQPDKSLLSVATTHIELLTGQRVWHRHEAQLSLPAPRPETALGASQVHYLADARGSDAYHELGLMIGARDLPSLPIAAVVMRDPAVLPRRFPGSTGLPVATGFGSWVGSWTDAFNALPAMLLLY